jgi:alkylhydroperoxidase domain protein/CMD domain protein
MTLSPTVTDVIAELSGIQPDSALAELRAQRPEAMTHAQGSYTALFDPTEVRGLSRTERLAVALRVATLHNATSAAMHYRQRLAALVRDANVVVAAAERTAGAHRGSPRLQALLRHADLLSTRPAQAGPENLQALADVGLTTQAIVTLSQTIAFVSFQVRVVAILELLDATERPSSAASAALRHDGHSGVLPTGGVAAQIVPRDPTLKRPTAFTVEQLAWAPWLQPLDLADATPEQAAALEGRIGNSAYFRLLALDPGVLTERTATDRGIFYTQGGAPRAERELSAAATSRLNGCIYCASVHARLAAQLSKRTDDIDRLLSKGVAEGTDLGFDDRWQAVVDLAVALAPTPPRAGLVHVERLRALGLSDLEILDVGQAAAFFAWANRLMLTLGEPYYPTK